MMKIKVYQTHDHNNLTRFEDFTLTSKGISITGVTLRIISLRPGLEYIAKT